MKFEQGNEYLDELLTNPETARQVAAAQRRPMIPAQAVEAAAIAWVGEHVWQGSEDSYRADYMRKARTILEAERDDLEALLLDNINWADGDTGSAVDAILTHYTKRPAP